MLVSTALRAGDIMYLIFILEICMVTFMVKGHMPSVHKLVQYFQSLYRISIYTLSDLGVLSNLIGSLSRAIQQYSPPSEWIMRNS